MSICDPDTSDEESNQNKKVYKSKPQMKRTKLTSPKPQRMSAKQAMENMQKIKSESNRMLREKEVSLPYHRPKALSLQDIMKRRKPAVTSDGKALPIKMNEEQLKQYVTMLEQRQREMMELCKSDTEEDEPIDTNEDMNNIPVNNTVTDNIGSDNANDDEKDFTEAPQTSTEEKELNKETLSEVNAKSPQWNSHTDEEIRENDVHEVSEISHEEKEPINEILTEVNAKSPQFNETKGDTSEIAEVDPNNKDSVDAINKSADLSAEIELVYNDSVEDDTISKVDVNNTEDIEMENNAETEKLLSNNINDDKVHENEGIVNENTSESCSEDGKSKTGQNNTELESQLISLQYNDSENTETINTEDIESGNNISKEDDISCDKTKNNSADEFDMTEFPDDDADMNDINMDEIDSIIENAEIIKNTSANFNSPALVRDNIPVLSVKPKLTGAPGMVIDLDGTDPKAPRKSGVQLLKERFTFFSKLKTPEEMEREREKRQKPGTLHLKLKQELEEKIAEQRSLEWAKRLDGEKQQQKELNAIRGEDSEPEDELDNLEAKLDEDDAVEKESSSEGEEEPIEDDVCLKDKPRKKNSLIADEAEESDEDGTEQGGVDDEKTNDDHNEDDLEDNAEVDDDVDADAEVSEEDSSEEDSSESEDEKETTKPKKGRILKAFEDSDDEDTPKLNSDDTAPVVTNVASEVSDTDKPLTLQSQSDVFTDSQDDVLHLAQVPKQTSGEILSSLDCVDDKLQSNSKKDDELLGTQTFSILNSTNTTNDINLQLEGPEKLNVISETQPYDDNLDAVVGMCSGSFSQNFVEFQPPTTQSQLSQSQPIGEDLLNMCTGNFYDNQFVSPADNDKFNTSDDISQDPTPCEPKIVDSIEKNNKNVLKSVQDLTPCEAKIDESIEKNRKHDENILKSVLDELNEPEIEVAKPLKFFFDGKNSNEQKKTKMDKENEEPTNTQAKKRFVIDSDDETNDNTEDKGELKKKKKFKKKKLEQRALQISDDEEEEYSGPEEADEYILSDNENEEEKLVEYDSEENEVEVQPQLIKKKKKKASEFFEQEAELTSEDEWVGSGDEDEAGLDRMEREEGDADTFHQGRLQRELGQIHMRDVLDQDKREVRLIQELLFEDGDLGGGGRQRKFRWRDADGEEATGTVPDELKDTQEEEFESEEQWRKQRHEREMFLRQLKNEGEKEDDLDVSVNRTTIIKANLTSRTMSSLLEEVNQTKVEVAHTFAVPEKKKDIPSPKKPFPVFQQNYHGSLLTRGRGALARLAALATPLVADDDAPKPGRLAPSSKRNFVFAAITPDDEPKVTKRKAETNVGTPRLVKKMKTEGSQDKLFPYAEENVKQFLDNQWEAENVKEAVVALRKLALEDQEKSVEGVVAIPGEDASKEDQIEGLVNNVKWQMSADRKVGPLKQLQGLIWKQGYDSGDIKGHVYDDVMPALEQWRSVDERKVYIYSSGSVDAQKLLFGQSLAGDLLRFIDGHFDTAVGAKQEAASYAKIVEKIGCKADEILFLTDIVKEAEAARASGLQTALVSREGNAPLPAAASEAFAVIHSLEQLAASKKRKPDSQDEVPELPAKVPKTDIEDDVKSAAEAAPAAVEETVPEVTEPEPKKEGDQPEQMEVEQEETAAPTEQAKEDKVEDVPMEDTVVEEVTDAKEIENVPVADIEPIISEEKTEEKETEKMEAQVIEPVEVKTNGAAEVKNGDDSAPVAEETPPSTVITEIEEITGKQDLEEVGEIIEDLEPVIEEPPAVEDMEDLQNVGEVLEKECDEILSKVQDVTNLDNIPLKPLLNTIAEETMETENTDSNDIVDRILDTELELEMKQCGDIDLNTVSEITDKKSETAEEKTEKVEEKTDEVPKPEEKPAESAAEEMVTDGNTVSNSSEPETKTETAVAENKMDESAAEASKVAEPVETEAKPAPEATPITEAPVASEATDVTPTPEVQPESESKPTPEADSKEAEEKPAPAVEEPAHNEEPVSEEVKVESETKEPQMNGKATNGENGDAEVKVNGDASKNEELNARLSVEENGKEVVNGSNGANGDSTDAEKGQGDNKPEPDVADIKVKTVAVDEPRTDPIEQPTEA
ncbi:claspin-like [Ostrinia furnacalis]|uniref:claspin-like n=1 Tax=Ostrinia furnacalis TaxID=93504 RepID=UPI00103C8E99|nr:claspin-like [Ostrinia furnacalis]